VRHEDGRSCTLFWVPEAPSGRSGNDFGVTGLVGRRFMRLGKLGIEPTRKYGVDLNIEGGELDSQRLCALSQSTYELRRLWSRPFTGLTIFPISAIIE
jgi:hypothetical protein